jgi:hypothetical protein
MAELNASFASALPMPEITWTLEKNCVVYRLKDSRWYRAQIDGISEENSMIS